MLPPAVAVLLDELGHEATTPAELGAHNLSDEVLVQLAAETKRVIVTENASDFAAVIDCPVLFVRKSWWSTDGLASRLASALDHWAQANPRPGNWAHWLSAGLR